MKKRFSSTLFFIFITLILTSCGREAEVPEPQIDDFLVPVKTLEEFDVELINIMGQVDLVPYYQKQIDKKHLAEDRQGQGEGKEFEPVPVNIGEVLLMDILSQEMKNEPQQTETDQEIPDDIMFIWYKINTGINKLHQKWNDLEPELEKNRVSAATIDQFDNSLNRLTLASSKKQYLEALHQLNALTGHLAAFAQELNNDLLAAIYGIKFHSRQLVLDMASNNNQNTAEHLEAIRKAEKVLTSELEKENYQELAAKLKTAIADLEKALSQQEISVVKIRASMVVRNISVIKEKLTI